VNRTDLQALANLRLNEASALLSLGMYDGAFYLAGYSVECALKACIAKGTQRGDFPDKKRVDKSHSHDLPQLADLAGLQNAVSERSKSDAVFRRHWRFVQDWSEQSRYRRYDSGAAREMLKAVKDRRHGILPWLKRLW
jgi:HEPN domain-containing protein